MTPNRTNPMLLVLALGLLTTPLTAQSKEETLRATRAKADAALEKGVAWLRSGQNPDGGYGPTNVNPRLEGVSDVGLTAFALYSLALAGEPAEAPSIKDALAFVLARQQKDGSFYDLRDPSNQEYKTSVVVLALAALDRSAHAEAIASARDFLKSRQYVETRGFSKDSPYYGGIGYDGKTANLSVTKYVVEALHESGLSSGDSVWENVRTYLSRNQNAKEVDPVLKRLGVGTTRDGGFRYGPDFTRGPESTLDDGSKAFSSYGSMTYAGLLSFLYAQVDKDDERVRSAFKWISDNFTVDINPGMATPENPELGYQGLFYYYHTMSKALSVYGQPIVTDKAGRSHDWAVELTEKLVSIQKENGLWVNESKERWMEGLPTLASCYATIALATCRSELTRRLESSGKPAGATPAGPEK